MRSLQRFVEAQDGGAYDAALAELRRGRKTSHWMWFVFPQLAGLGSSTTAQLYAIDSIEEARAYLVHEILGPRLRLASSLALDLGDRPMAEVFGTLDAMKLRSSMTLFHRADPGEPIFSAVLDRCFDSSPDERTDALLDRDA